MSCIGCLGRRINYVAMDKVLVSTGAIDTDSNSFSYLGNHCRLVYERTEGGMGCLAITCKRKRNGKPIGRRGFT